MFLGIEGIGLSSLINKNLGTSQAIGHLGVNQGFIQIYNNEDPKNLELLFFSMSFYIGIISSTLFALITYFSGLDSMVAFLAVQLYFLFEILNFSIKSIYNVKGHQVSLNLRLILPRIASVAILYLMILEVGLLGLVVSLLITSILDLIILSFNKGLKIYKPSIILQNIVEVKELYNKGLFHGLSGIIGKVSALTLVLFIEKELGISEVGIYAITVTLIDLAFTLLNQILTNEYYPDARRKFLKGGYLASRYVAHAFLKIFTLSILGSTLLYFSLPNFIEYLYEVDYELIKKSLGIYLLITLNRTIITPISYLVLIFGKRRLFFFLDGILSNILYTGIPIIFFLIQKELLIYFKIYFLFTILFILGSNAIFYYFYNKFSPLIALLSTLLIFFELLIYLN